MAKERLRTDVQECYFYKQKHFSILALENWAKYGPLFAFYVRHKYKTEHHRNRHAGLKVYILVFVVCFDDIPWEISLLRNRNDKNIDLEDNWVRKRTNNNHVAVGGC